MEWLEDKDSSSKDLIIGDRIIGPSKIKISTLDIDFRL